MLAYPGGGGGVVEKKVAKKNRVSEGGCARLSLRKRRCRTRRLSCLSPHCGASCVSMLEVKLVVKLVVKVLVKRRCSRGFYVGVDTVSMCTFVPVNAVVN